MSSQFFSGIFFTLIIMCKQYLEQYIKALGQPSGPGIEFVCLPWSEICSARVTTDKPSNYYLLPYQVPVFDHALGGIPERLLLTMVIPPSPPTPCRWGASSGRPTASGQRRPAHPRPLHLEKRPAAEQRAAVLHPPFPGGDQVLHVGRRDHAIPTQLRL